MSIFQISGNIVKTINVQNTKNARFISSASTEGSRKETEGDNRIIPGTSQAKRSWRMQLIWNQLHVYIPNLRDALRSS